MKETKGITLIALVITIIVLLVLAGVAINAITGNEGILSNSKKAADKYSNRVELENQILAKLTEYLEESVGDNNNNPGGTGGTGGNTDNPGGGTVTPPEETVTDFKADLVKNPDKYKNTDQTTITDDIAIGENGEKVNLDLWNYCLETPTEGSYYVLTAQRKNIGNYESSASSLWTEWKCSYKGNIVNGTIEGKIPAYIYNKTTKMAFPVKVIVNLFMNGEGGYDSAYEAATEKVKTLTNIEIPSTVTEIGSCAFYNCVGLENITIPSTVTKIGPGAFSGSGISTITIPDSVTSIGMGAFGNCKKLTTIAIPEGVTEIPTGAFDYNTSLQSITIPSTVNTIGQYSFRNCTSLKTVEIPEGVAEIDICTFEGDSALESIIIPKSVKTIWGERAFRDCNALKQINYRGTSDEWKAITKYGSSGPFFNVTPNYNYK